MNLIEIQCYLTGLGHYKLKRKDGSPAIDGIGGPATRTAIYNFQLAHRKRPDGSTLDTDGVWGPATEKALREVIYFDESPQTPPEPTSPPDGDKDSLEWVNINDFKCRCGGRYCNGWPAQPHEKTLWLLNEFGKHFKIRPVVHSGLRCKNWNAHEGGVPTSKHLYGMAVDFHIPGVSNQALKAYAETLMPNWGGIGLYSWGIHIDDRPVKGRW